MDATTIQTILIVILSVGFITLLILSIILVSIMIAVMKNVRRISERAEEASANVAEIASTVGRRLAPLAVSGLGAAVFRWLKKGKK